MPFHAWTRVGPEIFHDFHCGSIVESRNALNNGLLPPDDDALAEQISGDLGSDGSASAYAMKQRGKAKKKHPIRSSSRATA